MCPEIDNPASRKIRILMHFVHANNMSAAEIHHESCMIYSQNVKSEKAVRQWWRMFKDEQTNVHDEE
jgi:hypothetical protein